MNLHAVAQIERALKVGPFPDDAVHGGRIVLYLEIAVAAAGVGAAKARDLAQNAQLRNAVQRPGGDVDRLRDGDGVFLLSRRARGPGKVPTIHGQPSFHVVAHQCAPAPPRAPISRAHRGAFRDASLYGSQSTASPGHMLKKTSNKAGRCGRFRCERCARNGGPRSARRRPSGHPASNWVPFRAHKAACLHVWAPGTYLGAPAYNPSNAIARLGT